MHHSGSTSHICISFVYRQSFDIVNDAIKYHELNKLMLIACRLVNESIKDPRISMSWCSGPITGQTHIECDLKKLRKSKEDK